MGWLSLGFGKTVKVTSIDSENSSKVKFEKEALPAWKRISAAVCAILLFPISLICAGIGCIGFASSESARKLSLDYSNFRSKPQNETIASVNELIAPDESITSLKDNSIALEGLTQNTSELLFEIKMESKRERSPFHLLPLAFRPSATSGVLCGFLILKLLATQLTA